MRILVVAPYPPRRDGIAVYARDQVARLRAGGEDVTVLSPPDGDGDVRTPFLGGRAFLRAARMGAAFDRIVVHFQPALYYRPRRAVSKIATSAALLVLAATRGRRLELLVHEADPPALWRPDYALLRWAFRVAGTLAFHTQTEHRALERNYRVRVNGAVVPHRVEPAGGAAPSRTEARRGLGVDEGRRIFLCVGFVQPSKGFDRAVDAFGALKNAGPASLYVVGSVREPTAENRAYATKLRERCEATPGATFLEGFVNDEEFDLWLAAADWVLLPYRRVWSSGVLARAQTVGTPALVAKEGGLAEQAGKDDVMFDDDEGLRRAMRERAGG
jgi:glycosyltransferase involved in cell wall biosynthesis